MLAESIEIKAWRDCFAAAPASLGCAATPVPGTAATLFRATAVPALIMNRVLGLAPTTALSGDTLEWIRQTYRDGMIDDYLLTVWDGLDDNRLRAQCDRAGWQPDAQTVHAKFLFELDRPLPAVRQDTPFTVRRAQAGEQAIAGDIICRNFGMPDTLAPWLGAMAARPQWQMYFACDANGAPVATGALFIDGTQAWLGMGTTLPAARQQGAQQMLLATRLAAAKAAGCVTAAIETAASTHGEVQHSLNNVRRLGFRELGQRLNYLRHSAPAA